MSASFVYTVSSLIVLVFKILSFVGTASLILNFRLARDENTVVRMITGGFSGGFSLRLSTAPFTGILYNLSTGSVHLHLLSLYHPVLLFVQTISVFFHKGFMLFFGVARPWPQGGNWEMRKWL